MLRSLEKLLGLWRLIKEQNRITSFIWPWKNMKKVRILRLKKLSISLSQNSDKLTTRATNWGKMSTKEKGRTWIGVPNRWSSNSNKWIFQQTTCSWPSWMLIAGCLKFTWMKSKTISQIIGKEGTTTSMSLISFSQETTWMCLRSPEPTIILWALLTLSTLSLSQGFHSLCQIILSAIILSRELVSGILWNKPSQKTTISCKNCAGKPRVTLRLLQFMCHSINWTLKPAKGTWLICRRDSGRLSDIRACLMIFLTQSTCYKKRK